MGKWHELSFFQRPVRYDIRITYTDSINMRRIAITISVLGNITEVEYNQLIPQQQYRCCVFAIYPSFFFATSYAIGCNDFRTNPSPTQPYTNPSSSPCPNSLNSNSTPIVGGVLGFVIALLVLLLVVAGVGLAYLQCVRSRGKDNSR